MSRRRYFIQQSVMVMVAALLWTMTVCVNSVRAQADQPDSDRPVYRTESFSIDTPAELNVHTSGGFINVSGREGSDVTVKVYVQKDGQYLSTDQTDLKNYDLTIEHEGSKIDVRAKSKGFWGNNSMSVSFVVTVPRQTSSELHTSGGSITTKNLEGQQQVRTSGGHLTLTDIEGKTEARTSGGHINLSNVTGDTEARTSGGHIQVDGLTGNSSLRTSGGHITLNDIAGTINARTSGGHINAAIVEVGDHVDLKTSGGNVHVTVPGGKGYDLDLEGNMVSSKLENFNGSVERDEVKGTVNGGGPRVYAKTSGGMVKVDYK